MADPSKPLLGKRKKKVKKCANPLFVAWVTEWRDEAQERGWNSRFSYSKALNSLKKYPLPFASGHDCRILEFFGDKLCKMLDKRLEEHIAEYGSAEILSSDDDEANVNPAKRLTHAGSNSGAGTSSNTDDSNNNPTPGKKRRKSGAREYIPAYRSAPYALMLTLNEDHESFDSKGYMYKKELCDQAQKLADKSMTTPEPGTYYAGWSSMGSLIRKGYVTKESVPAKYRITYAGLELARKILAVGEPAEQASSDSSRESSPVRGASASTSRNDFPKAGTSSAVDTYPPPTTSAGHGYYEESIPQFADYDPRDFAESSSTKEITPGLQFTYLDDSGREVKSKDMAEVIINEELGVGFLIKCKYTDLLMYPKRYQLDHARSRDGEHVFAYLHNEDADETSNWPSKTELVKPVSTPISPQSRPSVPTVSSSKPASLKSSTTSSLTAGSSSNPVTRPPTAKPTSLPMKSSVKDTVRATISLPKSFSPVKNNSQDSQGSTASSAGSSTVESFTLYPGQFTVVLCVDNREHFGTGSSKQNLLPELNRNGVNLDVRNLAVGDFAWIAKEKVKAKTGQLQLPQSRELVLDWIVERKRMDDLCQSIKDGRFKEQKFRMRNSGLRRPTYLVEAYGSGKNFGIPEETLNQAVINSQIVDHFHIKRTRDMKETVAYLTVMTRQLQKKLNDKTLISCTRGEIDHYKDDLTKRSGPLHLLNFDEFNKVSLKNQPLTVRDMFAKQLMTLSGMSQDKASAVLKQYPVPIKLFQAYQNCASERERENLLAGLKFGQSTRGLGNAISKSVYLLYNREKLAY